MQTQEADRMFLARAGAPWGNALVFRESSLRVAEFTDKVVCPREVNVLDLNFIPVIHLYHAFRYVNNNCQ